MKNGNIFRTVTVTTKLGISILKRQRKRMKNVTCQENSVTVENYLQKEYGIRGKPI